LVFAVCKSYDKAMPYLFEQSDDYTELLMPDDLLSGNSILAYTREAMTPDACEDVEVLGWLYQFYISEKKDEVFADLKRNRKITPENIPAATQLFTPHWIVRYLVENSLGRLWMLNRPKSRLIEQMDYYIQPEQAETEFLRISKPQDLKICDPACGSGHMLVYAFDLLYAIYEEEGYGPSEIPEKILIHNLYGIEIDERAGALAAFALTMKVRAKQRLFFRKPIQPKICVLEGIQFADSDLKDYMDFIGRDLFTSSLVETLHQFREADNFGSLIRPKVTDVKDVLSLLEKKDVEGQLLLYQIHPKVLKALQQADYLNPKYHVVVTNPPYMGGKGMNGRLGSWLKDNYPISKSDLFAVFVERIMDIVQAGGFIGLMSPFTWMFLSSYEKLRSRILNENTLIALVRPEYHAFFESAYVPICAFILFRNAIAEYKGAFIDLQEFYGTDNQPIKALEAIADPKCGWFYRASSTDFKKIPGSPIAYWVSDALRSVFSASNPLKTIGSFKRGIATGNNERFLRLWHEVSLDKKGCPEFKSENKWQPYNKGGDYRKWFGNREYIIDWANDGFEVKNFKDAAGKLKSRPQNIEYSFKPAVSYSSLTSGLPSMRLYEGFIHDQAGNFLPICEKKAIALLAFLNSKVSIVCLKFLSPTLNILTDYLNRLPVLSNWKSIEYKIAEVVIELSKKDWNSYETSWNFTTLPLLNSIGYRTTLEVTYINLRDSWQRMTDEMKCLEEENNRIFIEAYGLQNELTSEVPLGEITLTCNPHYRYDSNKSEDELEVLLLADTIREFISYAVGCMFGRYSLDKPGLILANEGETIEDYLKEIPDPTFSADTDNVIPMLDGDWFPDDISEQFRRFLRVTFGGEHYETNLKFIQKALGKDIRRYFLRDFYNDHIRRYKKRPIYWLFSSSKGTFNALIYMHRYRPNTVGIVRNDYLRKFCDKLGDYRSHLEPVSINTTASTAERTKALKEIEALKKMIAELESYEEGVLYPLDTEQVAIDLNDGVKVNYGRFGAALKKIPGFDVAED